MISAFIETSLVYRVGMAFYTYHMKLAEINSEIALLNKHLIVPDTAKIATLIFITVSLLKIALSVANYSHAACRTDRTVENVNGH